MPATRHPSTAGFQQPIMVVGCNMMLKRLGAEVSAIIKKKNLSQKHVAVAFADAVGLELGTVTSDLSQLVNGKPGGHRTFFAQAERAEAFAKALSVKPAELRALYDACERGRYLVLDPKLSAAAREFIIRQQDAEGATYECIQVPPGGSLRDVAKQHEGCLVVLEKALEWFEGARIETTLVIRLPRGYRLVAAPTMVPVPPPPPPRAFDDAGNPLMACEARAKEIRQGGNGVCDRQGRALRPAVEALVGRGEIPTFPVADVLLTVMGQPTDIGWDALPDAAAVREDLGRLRSPDGGVWRWEDPPTEEQLWSVMVEGMLSALVGDDRRDRTQARLIAALGLAGARTVVWTTDDHRIHAEGARAADVAQTLAAHGHQLHRPGAVVRAALDAIGKLNPWHRPRARWSAIAAPLRTSGLPVNVFEHWWETGATILAGEWRWSKADLYALAGSLGHGADPFHPLPAKSSPVTLHLKEDFGQRKALRAFLSRDLIAPPEDVASMLVLRALARAEILCLPLYGRDAFHVIANLGAGRTARVHAVAFPDDESVAIAVPDLSGEAGRFELDGGDVHVWLEFGYVPALEGAMLRPRQRRHKRAADG